MEIGQRAIDLFNVANYEERVAGYKALERATRSNSGASCIPLLQTVQTLVRKKSLVCHHYGNGWVRARAPWPGAEGAQVGRPAPPSAAGGREGAPDEARAG